MNNVTALPKQNHDKLKVHLSQSGRKKISQEILANSDSQIAPTLILGIAYEILKDGRR